MLVHSGDLNNGHYFSFLRPELKNEWFKFDDDKVTPAALHEVFDDNFGEDSVAPSDRIPIRRNMRRLTNAYMLVYIRESDRDEILCPITDKDIPKHLEIRFEKERFEAQRKKQEEEDRHLYVNVYILTDEIIMNHSGFDLCSDDESAQTNGLRLLKIRKDMLVADLKV